MSQDAFWAHGLQKDLGYQVTNTKKPKKFSGFSLSCYEMWLDPCTEGFMTPDLFHSTDLESWGSSRVSKAAKFIKDFNFLGSSCCCSARIEQFDRFVLKPYWNVGKTIQWVLVSKFMLVLNIEIPKLKLSFFKLFIIILWC